ncbi:hypothetical protein BJX68DRAFT_259726 [Aspergillus pseudodeflectus]|uniref:Uncharacterized protein n=1 Tax=Aspergillus pseudodeflectus TaxID=176178 RepID=A0ABR4JAI1_9EURO
MASQSQHSVPFAGQTRYLQMLLDVDYMPWTHNVIASVAHWTLLAGYLIVPGTFTALPIIMNAVAGLATTLINIYTTRDGDWSIMALITTIITRATLVAASSLTMVFKFIKLKEIQAAHWREVYLGDPRRST